MLLTGLMRKGWYKIRLWREIAHERRELRRLSEFIAKDIGISRAEAEREADRPFWDFDATRDGAPGRQQTAASGRQNPCLHAN